MLSCRRLLAFPLIRAVLCARSKTASAAMEERQKLHVNVDITSDVVCPWYACILQARLSLRRGLACETRFVFLPTACTCPIPPLLRCWIGKRHIDTAIKRLSEDFVFHLHWKPFLLNPHTPEQGVPLEEYMRNKFGEAAATRFLSGQSPVIQSGKAVVSAYVTPP